MRRFSPLVLTLLLVAACSPSDAPVTAVDSARSNASITFLHLNDTYRIAAVEDGTRGGFARVTSLIRDLRDEGRTVHVLHGGDFLYPSLESQLWNGEQMIDAFNFMHDLAPLIAVAGNHEFDRRSADAVNRAIADSDFTWLGGNVVLDGGDSSIDARLQTTHTVRIGGKRIGIFGLTLLPDDGGNARDYLHYEEDYVAAARRHLDAFEASSVDLILGLTHLHMEDDREVAKLREDYPRFVLIAGGHEHEPEYQRASAESAEIVKGASNARTIWRIDIAFEDDGGYLVDTQRIELDAEIPEDAEYNASVADKWRARLLDTIPFLESRIGEAAVRLDAREVTLRNAESNWGNFVVDQMRVAYGEPAADLAFLNSGTLRIDDYIAGDITFEDVARTFGFSSYLSYLTMSGSEFRLTLEAGYRGEGPSKGYFPQVSGFRVCVDRLRGEGGRIVQLQVPSDSGWVEIDDDREYTVVASDFLLRGGDGYQFPSHRDVSRPGSELKYLVFDAIVRAQARGETIGAPVDPANPRIAFVSDGDLTCFN